MFTPQFKQYTDMLQQYRPFWQVLPFACNTLPWQGTAVQQLLQQLTESQLAALEQDPVAQQQLFQPFFPALFQLPEPDKVGGKTAVPLPALPFWLENGIAGRKLLQIEALCQHWPQQPLPVLEWCAGKGHLGRILAHRFAQPVVSVEWQQSLCEQGAQLARQFQLSQQFICADVLLQPFSGVLVPQQQVVALHACGQLHISLLQQVVAAGCQRLQLVPCCYHLISDDHYQPLSALGQQTDLYLSKQDLKLVVQGQVTGGGRTERLRHTEVLWRLAYDELRKQLTGKKAYQPLASVAKHWFTTDFTAFANWAAQQHQLCLPPAFDAAPYLQRAGQRLLQVRKIELVRHLFRRPLELWLALDKAIYLQQHGYSVSLTEFCDYQLTPRNLLLQACKTADAVAC